MSKSICAQLRDYSVFYLGLYSTTDSLRSGVNSVCEKHTHVACHCAIATNTPIKLQNMKTRFKQTDYKEPTALNAWP